MKPVYIRPLFPTPLLAYHLGRDLSMEEYRYIEYNSSPSNTTKNIGNRSGTNYKVLEHPVMGQLKYNLTEIVRDAHDTICGVSDTPCDLYITQSWLNFSGRGEYHHHHFHPNSIYSAVFYVDVCEGDSILFSRPSSFLPLRFQSNVTTDYNYDSWNVPVYKNMVLIFPSSLEHSVNTIEHSNTRVSLAFNTFARGEIWATEEPNRLVI